MESTTIKYSQEMTFKNLIWGFADYEFLSSYVWASLCLGGYNVGCPHLFVSGDLASLS